MKRKQSNIISLINSFKTALACLIGLTVTTLAHVPSPQWTLVTILVVMVTQNRVGGAIRKGSSRFFATITGALLGALILFLFAQHIYVLYALLVICIFVLTYFAGIVKNYQDAFTLSSVTIVMILVTNNPQLHHAYDRFIEIMLGVIIALSVTKFIFPIHSKLILRGNLASILRQTSELYAQAICKKQSLHSISQYSSLEESIVQNLTLQPILLQEALLESIKFKKKKSHFTTIHGLERRLLRAIYLLYEAVKAPNALLKIILRSEDFVLLNQDIIQTMQNIIEKLETKKVTSVQPDMKVHLNKIILTIKNNWPNTDFAEQIKLGAFIFCTQYLLKILHRLNVVVRKV